MSKPTPFESKVTPVVSKLPLVQHTLQLALRTSEPVVKIRDIVLKGHRPTQQTHQTDLPLLYLSMQTGQIALLVRFLVMNAM